MSDDDKTAFTIFNTIDAINKYEKEDEDEDEEEKLTITKKSKVTVVIDSSSSSDNSSSSDDDVNDEQLEFNPQSTKLKGNK